MPKHSTRGYNRPKTYMFYLTYSDKSFYDLENPHGLNTGAEYLVEPIAVNSLAEARLVLDEIKQRSLVSCNGALHTFRRRRPKPLSIKVFGYRYDGQRKRVTKLKRKQNMGNAIARCLFEQYNGNTRTIGENTYSVHGHHVLPEDVYIDFVTTIFDYFQGGDN